MAHDGKRGSDYYEGITHPHTRSRKALRQMQAYVDGYAIYGSKAHSAEEIDAIIEEYDAFMRPRAF